MLVCPSTLWGHQGGVSPHTSPAHGAQPTTSAPQHSCPRGEAVLGQLAAITAPLWGRRKVTSKGHPCPARARG